MRSLLLPPVMGFLYLRPQRRSENDACKADRPVCASRTCVHCETVAHGYSCALPVHVGADLACDTAAGRSDRPDIRLSFAVTRALVCDQLEALETRQQLGDLSLVADFGEFAYPSVGRAGVLADSLEHAHRAV